MNEMKNKEKFKRCIISIIRQKWRLPESNDDLIVIQSTNFIFLRVFISFENKKKNNTEYEFYFFTRNLNLQQHYFLFF